MKAFCCILLLLALLAPSHGSPVAERTHLNAKYLRARQLAPYPAAGLRPQVPFVLPTEQGTEAAILEATTDTQVKVESEEAIDQDLAEDLDPIAADAAEDDTEPLPEPEAQMNANGEEAKIGVEEAEEDENADIIPERKAGPSPSKRFWFFRR